MGELRKVVLRLPTLLGMSVEDNMAPKLEWLQARIDLDDPQLRKVVLGALSVLSTGIDTLESKLEWLQMRLDLDVKQLRKVVLGRPQLLGMSVKDNLAPTLDWLQGRLDLDAEQSRKVVLAHPQLLAHSIEANIAPKLVFFEKELRLTLPEIRDWVVKIPTGLSYSLANRYRSRLEACRAAGVDGKRYVLSYATSRDELFCKYSGVAPSDLEAIQDRQKAAS